MPPTNSQLFYSVNKSKIFVRMPIRIGVFAPYGAQTLDAACVDVLGSMSKEYLSLILELPSYIAADLAPSTTFSYINSPSQGDKIELTSGIVMKATHNYEDEDVAPGKLDIVIIPGPDPNTVLEEPALDWLRKQFATPGVDILSICTGIFLVGASGIGNNKTVSGPRGLQKQLSEKFPKMKLAGEKYRWVRDGNLWSSGEYILWLFSGRAIANIDFVKAVSRTVTISWLLMLGRQPSTGLDLFARLALS